MNQGWEYFDELKIDESQCVHLIVILIACMFTVHACRFNSYMYICT